MNSVPEADLSYDFMTASGQAVWFLRPMRTRVVVTDITTHLSRIGRYTGALPWNDLQHSVLVGRLASRCTTANGAPHGDDAIAAATLHDAHEYVLGDITTNLKRLLPAIVPIAEAWDSHIYLSFGFRYPLPAAWCDLIRLCDARALIIESTMMSYAGLPGIRARTGDVREITELEKDIWFEAYSAHTHDLRAKFYALLQGAPLSEGQPA